MFVLVEGGLAVGLRRNLVRRRMGIVVGMLMRGYDGVRGYVVVVVLMSVPNSSYSENSNSYKNSNSKTK